MYTGFVQTNREEKACSKDQIDKMCEISLNLVQRCHLFKPPLVPSTQTTTSKPEEKVVDETEEKKRKEKENK